MFFFLDFALGMFFNWEWEERKTINVVIDLYLAGRFERDLVQIKT